MDRFFGVVGFADKRNKIMKTFIDARDQLTELADQQKALLIQLEERKAEIEMSIEQEGLSLDETSTFRDNINALFTKTPKPEE